jgi:hypothetical protein
MPRTPALDEHDSSQRENASLHVRAHLPPGDVDGERWDTHEQSSHPTGGASRAEGSATQVHRRLDRALEAEHEHAEVIH